MSTAIITGASAGLGKALAEALTIKEFRLGLMARRADLMTLLKHRSPEKILIQPTDFGHPDIALEDFKKIWDSLGQVDVVILNAGVSLPSDSLSWMNDRRMIQVNISAFTALAGESIRRFLKQGHGQLVGISSIAGSRGSGHAPVYGAAKAFISSYLQGLRQQVKAVNSKIFITDIRPGFIDTEMVRAVPFKFWMSSPAKAAAQILEAVRKKKRVAYVSRRWSVLAGLYSLLPESLLEIIYAKSQQRKN